MPLQSCKLYTPTQRLPHKDSLTLDSSILMASSDKDGKKEAVVKAAGAAVTAGVLWSIFSFFKGKRNVEEKDRGVPVTTDGENDKAEEVFRAAEQSIIDNIFPASYGEEGEGQDYYNDKIIKDAVEKFKGGGEKVIEERIEKIIKDGSEVNVNVVYVEEEVVAYVKPENDVVVEKSTEEKKKPWFLSLIDGLLDEKNKSFGIFQPKEGFSPGSKLKETNNRAISSPTRENDVHNHHQYDIKKGDTLWAISGKYGISLETLKAANGLKGDKIYAGEKLAIPAPE